jgi:hypothetical protein
MSEGQGGTTKQYFKFIHYNNGSSPVDITVDMEDEGANVLQSFYINWSAAYVLTAFGNAQVDTAQSKFGGASALFDGTGDYITTDAPVVPKSGDFTIECWVRPAATGVRYDMLSQYDGAGEGRLVVNTTAASKFEAFIGTTLGNVQLTSTMTYSANTWYHVAFVRNNNNYYLYVDGTLEASDTGGKDIVIKDQVFMIGGGTVLGNMNGHIDEVRVSYVARYTSNFTPSTTAFNYDNDTWLLLHCDGADASTTFDDDIYK